MAQVSSTDTIISADAPCARPELRDTMKEKLKELPSLLRSNCSIYRVPKPQLERKKNAYEPRMVSIGPFYRGNENLKAMETHKLQYLNDFLFRHSRSASPPTLEDYINAMAEMEQDVQQCYSEIIQLQPGDEFVKMMVIDVCFILELVLKGNDYTFVPISSDDYTFVPISSDDPIMNATWMPQVIMSDLILLENQLPFSVLRRLYGIFKGNFNSNSNSIAINDELDKLLSSFFESLVPRSHSDSTTPEGSQFRCKVKEAIDSIWVKWRILWQKKDQEEAQPLVDEETPSDVVHKEEPHHLLHFVRNLFLQSSAGLTPEVYPQTIVYINCAINLKEASVKFEEETKITSLLDITFNNNIGVLKIPAIEIEDGTESLLRNLIAFEQSNSAYKGYITSYAFFFDSLINSPDDVELLERKGIIRNLLGEPKDVATLFNDLVKDVTIPGDCFHNTRCDLKKYYATPRHKWKASLVHKYFNSPWAFISLLAASFLLFLTVVQTICSIIALT